MNLSEWDNRRPFGRLIILPFLILFLFSCGRKDSIISSNRYSQKSMDPIAVLKEARHSDLPVPIGYEFINMQDDQDQDTEKTDFLCYMGNLSIDKAIDYYCKNMERFGWDISNFSTDSEGLLFCNKVNKDCIVSIRKDTNICKRYGKKNCVCLFVKNRNYSKDKISDINSKKIPSDYFTS